jgi:hypothetical protein
MPTYAIWVAIGWAVYFQTIVLAVVLFWYIDWDTIPELDAEEAEIEFVRANSITQKEDIVENLL